MNLFKNISQLIFPLRCPCCNKLNSNDGICTVCNYELNECAVLGKICRHCGHEKHECECGKYHYLFEGMASPYHNTGAAKDGIYGMKFAFRPDSARFFGVKTAEYFVKKFKTEDIDLVCMVPTHPKKAKQREYDYVALLAKTVAKHLNIKFRPKTLKKIRNNESQHSLTADKRQSNVKGAFVATSSLKGKTVLLVDDIKTTGYTLNECSKQLRMAGAQKVYCATALITSKSSCKTQQIEI